MVETHQMAQDYVLYPSPLLASITAVNVLLSLSKNPPIILLSVLNALPEYHADASGHTTIFESALFVSSIKPSKPKFAGCTTVTVKSEFSSLIF